MPDQGTLNPVTVINSSSSPIPVAINFYELVNAQTGTTYTVLASDWGKLVTFSNGSAVAVTLPQANSTTFPAGFRFDVVNIGAGTVTITPTTSTIQGASTLVLTTGKGATIVSDGTNYFIQPGLAGTALQGVSPVVGVASGYKIARGVHQQAAASDTIVTGLTTVVACGATWRDTPTLKQLFLTSTIGDQAGSPAAGSILVKSFKPTAANDVTPIAATDFSDNLSSNWLAIGT